MSQTHSPQFQQDVSLKPYNTLGIDAVARRFVNVESAGQLHDLLKDPDLAVDDLLILGGGSNVLFVSDYDGLVLRVAVKGIETVKEDDQSVWVRAGSGEVWHDLVRHCVTQGWGGIENLSLIPGTVGAAPIQNIGAYGAELRDVFSSLEAVELNTGTLRTFSSEECRFGYRDSVFKQELKGRYLVTHVTLRLSKNPEVNTSYGAIRSELENRGIDSPGIADVSRVICDIRRSKLPDPESLGNAGSFFKNPIVSREQFEALRRDYPEIPGYPEKRKDAVKVPAGWLIEKAGWKGRTVGKAGTYANQALVIVNHGGASGREILDLAQAIQNEVREQFQIVLEPEVNIISEQE